ncbi:MAG: hypothetical protein J0H01_18835 [Rhizobiales bacterium]|nr:hypothetical protein [Hyphomicrobiales bacterium]
MDVKRYELSDEQWERIAGLLPGKVGRRGRHPVEPIPQGRHPSRRRPLQTAQPDRALFQHFRRFATRYERRTIHFRGFALLATATIWMA